MKPAKHRWPNRCMGKGVSVSGGHDYAFGDSREVVEDHRSIGFGGLCVFACRVEVVNV